MTIFVLSTPDTRRAALEGTLGASFTDAIRVRFPIAGYTRIIGTVARLRSLLLKGVLVLAR